MTEQEKIEWLVDPGNFFPRDLRRGELCGNKGFIDAVTNYSQILSESQFWPRERLEEIQVKRLRNLTGRIAMRSNFWNHHFQKNGFIPKRATLADLQRLPILRRASLLELGDAIYVEPQPEDYPLYKRTNSGTTGIPLKLIYSEREMIMGYTIATGCVLFKHAALEKLSLADLLSRKPFVVLGTPGFRYVFEKDFFSHSFPLIQSLDLDNLEVRKEIYKSICEATPAILVGFSSLIAKLARWISEDGVTLPLLAVRTSSEPTSSAERENISRALKVPIVNVLSGNGTSVVGFECPENQGNFHVNSENILLEVVDENGVVLPEGESGELVVTSLTFTLTPIIRYAHNDNGQLVRKACHCGRTLPLFEFHGRRGYEVALPSGRKIPMIHIYSALMEHGLSWRSRQIQIVQNRPDNLRLLIIPKSKFSDLDEVNIRMALTQLFGNEKINIEIEYVESIPAGRGHKPNLFVPLSESNA